MFSDAIGSLSMSFSRPPCPAYPGCESRNSDADERGHEMQAYFTNSLEKYDFKSTPARNRAEKYTQRQVCRYGTVFSTDHDGGFPKLIGDESGICKSQKNLQVGPFKMPQADGGLELMRLSRYQTVRDTRKPLAFQARLAPLSTCGQCRTFSASQSGLLKINVTVSLKLKI